MRPWICLLTLALAPITACGRPAGRPVSFQSDDVNERILAIRQAAEQDDKTTIPLLVDRLEDEDEAVRFFAILALDMLTGRRFGYDYGQPSDRRAKAVELWREYVRDPKRAMSRDGQTESQATGGSASKAAASGI